MMKRIYTVKAVRMNEDILEELASALETLHTLTEDLKELAYEESDDDSISELRDGAIEAWAGLSNFLDDYVRLYKRGV